MIKLVRSHVAFETTLLLCFVFITAWAVAGVGQKPELSYKEGRINLKADQTPMLELLGSLSEVTGVDVFISEELALGEVSLELFDETLENGFKRILRAYNHAAIYSKEGDEWRMTAIKIYPKGKYGGEVIPVSPKKKVPVFSKKPGETKVVMIFPGEEFITHGIFKGSGTVMPSQTDPIGTGADISSFNKPLFVFQKKLERQEMKKYKELMLIKEEMDNTVDPEQKEALASVYAEELERFIHMKKSHLNRVEALKRIRMRQELKKTQKGS